MPRKSSKQPKETAKKPPRTEVPPGATRKALDRPIAKSGGPPGSAGGPRHAADDIGSENETFGRSDTTRTPASPPFEEKDRMENGPPYSGRSGGAVGGTPAQLRSSEGPPNLDDDFEQQETDSTSSDRIPSKRAGMMRLTGSSAIEYAEKQGLTLNKHPDSIMGPRVGLTVAEAQAIAEDDADLIWLDVDKEEYYSGPPTNYEPAY